MLYIGFFVVLTGSVLAKECDYDEFSACMRDVMGLEAGDFNIVSEEQMKEVCNSKRKTIQCASDFIKNCMKPGEKDLYEATTGGKLKVVEQMCSSGTRINTGFLQNINCFRKLQDEIEFCNEKFKESQTAINKADMVERLKIFYGCCAFEWHRNCLGKAARMKCGDEASDFVYYVSTALGGQLQNQICSSSYSSCHGLHGVDHEKAEEELEDMSDASTKHCASLKTQTILLIVTMFLTTKMVFL